MQKNEVYIIAEIGQNHNGDIEMAKKLIDMAAMPIFDTFGNRQLRGVNAIKLTKRDMAEELTVDDYNRPYDSPHSFGKTYGEHRERLELNYEQHAELEQYCHNKGLEFVETLCSPKTLHLLEICKIDYIKIASRDLSNVPLLERVAETKVPVILSRGMSDQSEIDAAIKIFECHHSNITLMHCVSQYPAEYKNLNLRSINALINNYGQKFRIGYSDHSPGIMAPIMAVALGAKVIEKHITLSHALKGSDHAGSLEMEGLWRMTRDIRNAEEALGDDEIKLSDAVKTSLSKLRRSIAINQSLDAGEILKEHMLVMLSPGNGMRWQERNKILGKKALLPIKAQTLLSTDQFK